MATWLQNVFTTTQLRRWISPDSIEYLDPSSINGLNLYCYCMNNPIMYADPSGHFAISLYTIQGITQVSAAVFGSTFLGNMIGW